MSVGEGYVPDPVLGAKALNAVDPGGVLLADAGFDAGQVFRGARGKFIPMIRLEGGGKIKDTQREAEEPHPCRFPERVSHPCAVLCGAGTPRLIAFLGGHPMP